VQDSKNRQVKGLEQQWRLEQNLFYTAEFASKTSALAALEPFRQSGYDSNRLETVSVTFTTGSQSFTHRLKSV
jgi:hypothetical protein